MRKKTAATAEPLLETAGEGRYSVAGELSFATVSELWRRSGPLLTGGEGPLVLDLAQISRADSAGVALLVEWTRQAREAGREIRFEHIPDQLLAIARVSALEEVLPLG